MSIPPPIYIFNSGEQKQRHVGWAIIFGTPLYFMLTFTSLMDWAFEVSWTFQALIITYLIFQYLFYKLMQAYSKDSCVYLSPGGIRITKRNPRDSRNMRFLKSLVGMQERKTLETYDFPFDVLNIEVKGRKLKFDNGTEKKKVKFPANHEIWNVLAEKNLIEVQTA